jgi:oxygen-independent coproporphyrinogen-3 oxidase
MRIVEPRDSATAAGQGPSPGEFEMLAASMRHLGMRQVIVELCISGRNASPSAQWLQNFVQTVEPDRIRLTAADQVSGRELLATQRDTCVQTLAELGYQHIGVDWFVRSSNRWWQARLALRLNWSLLGFTDMPRPDVVGIGPGAISAIGDSYAQNASDWDGYQTLLNRGDIPTQSGLELESDDILRREIMVAMLTASRIDITPIENKWGIEFRQFFGEELGYLKRFEKTGWVSIRAQVIVVHARGRHELAELCRIFDRRSRLLRDQYAPTFA